MTQHHTTTDAQLLDRFIEEGSEDAFAQILRRYGPLVHGICRRALHNPADQDDAWQATFFLLARQAGTIRNRAALASWLHGAARRVCSLAHRQAARRPHPLPPQATADPHPDPAVLAEAREASGIIEEELARLPHRYRAPLILACLHGLPKPDIIARLGLPPITVTGRLARGKALLRSRLAKRGLTPSVVAGLLSGSTSAHCWPAALVPLTLTAASALRLGTLHPLPPGPHSLMKGVLTMTALKRAQSALVCLALTLGVSLGALSLLPTTEAQDKPQGAKAEYADPDLARDYNALQGRWVERAQLSGNASHHIADVSNLMWTVYSGNKRGWVNLYNEESAGPTFTLEKTPAGKVMVVQAKRWNAQKVEIESSHRCCYTLEGDLLILTTSREPNKLPERVGQAGSHLVTTIIYQRVSPADVQARRVREPSQQQRQVMQQLGGLAKAMHVYHQDFHRFPQAAFFDTKTGRPLLSWRVSLLPYLGHDHLFKEFKLDESWDSAHNKKLMPRMPPVFHHPEVTANPAEGLTYFQVFVGPAKRIPTRKYQFNPMFSLEPTFKIDLHQLTAADGTSGTMVMAEARNPVPWTKPEDLLIEHDEASLPPLGALPKGDDFLAAFADGSVHRIQRTLREKDQATKLLRQLIGYQDGIYFDTSPLEK